MSWVATAVIGSSVIGGYAANKASKKPSQAASDANQLQWDMFNRQIELTDPQRQLGYGAVNELSRLFGYGGPQQQIQQGPSQYNPYAGAGGKYGALADKIYRQADGSARVGAGPGRMQAGPSNQAAGPDMSAFMESPDYQFRKSQGMEGIAQTLGAGGQGAFSGNALRGLNEYNSNLASGEFGNFINRRLQMAGLGQTANFQAQDAMQSAGANIGNNMLNQGNARASGILGTGAALNNGIWGMLQAYGNGGLGGGSGGVADFQNEFGWYA